MPASNTSTCWVRSASVAECSVGSASASSKPLVCSDWQPPATAENACSATRTMFTSGCCAVSVEPPVCAWKRSAWLRGSRAPKRSRMMCAHRRRAARNLAISWNTSLCALKKNDRRGAKSSTARPAAIAAST